MNGETIFRVDRDFCLPTRALARVDFSLDSRNKSKEPCPTRFTNVARPDYSFDSESDKIDEDSSEEKSLSLKDELQDSGSSKKIDPSRLEDKCVANEKDPVQVNAKFDSSMDVSLNKPSCNTDSSTKPRRK